MNNNTKFFTYRRKSGHEKIMPFSTIKHLQSLGKVTARVDLASV